MAQPKLKVESKAFDADMKGWHVNGVFDDPSPDGITVSGRHFIPVDDENASNADLLAAIKAQYGLA